MVIQVVLPGTQEFAHFNPVVLDHFFGQKIVWSGSMKLGSVDQIPELFVCTHNLSKIVSILEVDCTDPRVSISVVKD